MSQKITEIQKMILAVAAKRTNGIVLPLPEDCPGNWGARASSLRALMRKGLVQEVAGEPQWKQGQNGEPVTLQITAAGLSYLGEGLAVPASPAKQPRSIRKGTSKVDLIIKQLGRVRGSTITQMQKATGWQPHSVRAALCRLRQKGLQIETEKRPGKESVYRLKEGTGLENSRNTKH